MDRLELAEYYAEQFFEISRFHSVNKMNENNKGCGFLLMYLYKSKKDRIIAGDIAKASGVSTARIAAALKKLEADGLIERTVASEDMRKTVVKLTDAGYKKARDKDTAVLSVFADVIESVGVDDIEEFLRIYKKIKDAAEKSQSKGEDNV